MKRFLALLVTLLMLCVLGCALCETKDSLTLQQDRLLIPVGEFKKIRYDASKSLEIVGFTFEASDPDGLYVSYTGQAKGLKLGEYTVTITSVKDPSIVAVLPVQVIQPVQQISLSVPETKLCIGQTTTLAYECRPENASVKEATFASSNDDVATIADDGTITAVGRGTATISVTSLDGAARNTIKITVQMLPTDITFQEDEYALALGKALKLKATVLPKGADNKELIWTSSDESIATVSNTGSIKAKAAGTVTITATCKADPSVKASVTLQCVQPIKSIKFDTTSYQLTAGDTLQLSPSYTPADATTSAVTYTSSASNVCTVDKTGLVTAIGGGKSTVTVTSLANSSRKASVTIHVFAPVKGISAYQTHVRVGANEHGFAKVQLLPGNASNKEIYWESSDPSIATVSNNTNRPRIMGYQWGDCELTGTTADGGHTITLNVHVGTPYKALSIETAKKRGGQIIVTLRNHSNISITGVRFAVEGEGVTELLPAEIAPGAVSGEITVELSGKSIAVAGWESSSFLYNNRGEQYNSCLYSDGFYQWHSTK